MAADSEEDFIRQFVDKPRLRRKLVAKATVPQLKKLVEENKFILNFDTALIPPKKRKSLSKRETIERELS